MGASRLRIVPILFLGFRSRPDESTGRRIASNSETGEEEHDAILY